MTYKNTNSKFLFYGTQNKSYQTLVRLTKKVLKVRESQSKRKVLAYMQKFSVCAQSKPLQIAFCFKEDCTNPHVKISTECFHLRERRYKAYYLLE